MSFDWSNYLNVAYELIGTPKIPSSIEAKQRTAISRAYYAAFKSARNYLRDKRGYRPPMNTNTHHDVVDKFLAKGTDEDMEIGQALQDLHDYRKKSDYDDRFNELNENTVKLAGRMAQDVLTGLPKLAP